MNKKYITLGLTLLIGASLLARSSQAHALALPASDGGETPVQAPAAPTASDFDTTTTWQATKLLSFNSQLNLGPNLGSTNPDRSTWKTKFAIGPGEWQVTYKEKDANGNLVQKYHETWSLPALPSCYGRDAHDCLPLGVDNGNGKYPGNFLWSLACGDTCEPGGWLTENLSVSDPELFKKNTGDRAWGQGSLGSFDDRNVDNIVTTGAYGWIHGRFVNYDRGEVTWAGAMIPLKWTVTGYFDR